MVRPVGEAATNCSAVRPLASVCEPVPEPVTVLTDPDVRAKLYIYRTLACDIST
jgi:hypothetical protein